MRTLKLTLQRKPFEVMITGEKQCVFLKPTKAIEELLFNPDGSAKEYDQVEIKSGRAKLSLPWQGTQRALISHRKRYSNGHTALVEKGDLSIALGRVIV